MDKERIDELIAGDSALENLREELVKMIPGAYCLHRSFGVGRIEGYNKEEAKLIISFGGNEPRLMDPVFCARKLDMLPDGDLLVQFYNDPEEIQQKLKKSSVAMLVDYLEGFANRRASLGDIERTFGKIVEEKNFKRWWNVTKKLIMKEPRLALEEGNVTYLKLCDEPVSEEEDLLKQFESVRDIAAKTSIAEKFIPLLKGNPDLKNYGEMLVVSLSELLSKSKKITHAERFQACVTREELAKLSGISVDSLSPKVEELVAEFPNLSKICDTLQPSYYGTFLQLITRVFPDEWEKLCLGILKNCNDRLANECIIYLKDNGCESGVQGALIKWLKEKSLRAPLLQWMVKNRHSKKFEGVFSQELMSPELLRSIFLAIDSEALLGSGRAKKIQLAELLSADRNLIRDLLVGATEEVAGDLAQTLLINQGIDNLTKKSLLARFIAEFSSVQDLIMSASKARLSPDVSIKVSKASLEAKRKEYDVLIKEKIPSNKLAIEVAREHGDLSENSEYKMARQDQDTLLARKAQLENELRSAQVVDFSNVDTAAVSIGSVVRVRQMSSGEVTEFTILGAWDSDPSHNVISYKTSVAQALLGRQQNDVVEMVLNDHKELWQVENIRAYSESKH